jgi:hypothetical protein
MLARLEEGLVPGDVVLMHDGVAAGADDRDRAEPAFPEEPLRLLEDAGAPAATLPAPPRPWRSGGPTS